MMYCDDCNGVIFVQHSIEINVSYLAIKKLWEISNEWQSIFVNYHSFVRKENLHFAEISIKNFIFTSKTKRNEFSIKKKLQNQFLNATL